MKLKYLTLDAKSEPAPYVASTQPNEILVQLGLIDSSDQFSPISAESSVNLSSPSTGATQPWKKKLNSLRNLLADSNQTPVSSAAPVAQPEEILVKLGLIEDTEVHKKVVSVSSKPSSIDKANQHSPKSTQGSLLLAFSSKFSSVTQKSPRHQDKQKSDTSPPISSISRISR